MSTAIEHIGSLPALGALATYEGDSSNQEPRSPKAQASQSSGLSQQQLDVLVQHLNDVVKIANTRLSFSVDRSSNRTIISVVDAESGQVIRQIPSEEVQRVAAQIKKMMGVLFDAEI